MFYPGIHLVKLRETWKTLVKMVVYAVRPILMSIFNLNLFSVDQWADLN